MRRRGRSLLATAGRRQNEHGNGISTLYAHNKSNEVKAGSCIRAGEVLGRVGATGNATGNHLHFEIRKNGKPINPLDYLP